MFIERAIKSQILDKFWLKKAIIIYGPRQAGKTTLLKNILSGLDIKASYQFISGEEIEVQKWMSSQSVETLASYIGSDKLLVIDEAQKIDNIGLNLKLIVDHLPEVQVIATGSSSFELANQVGEPLVGRKWQFFLFPIAQLELAASESGLETAKRLPERLIYGSYPEVITSSGREAKRDLLRSILDNYLFRDLLVLEEIRKSAKLVALLKLIAFQIGSEVSLRELAASLSLNIATVGRYLDLLEKTFVIKRVGGFSRNLRKEISKTSRYYFFDNGVRNALINNFNDLETRDDVGQLWENYLFMERWKKREYRKIHANEYFWRTYDQKEIDLVEEREGKLYGYEIKWGKKGGKEPKLWKETYKEAEYKTVNKENYLDFIT